MPSPQPHGHRKYIIAIFLIGIIALAVGFYIGYNIPAAPDVTYLTGATRLSSLYPGTPTVILFQNSDTGIISSLIFANLTYQTYLPIGFSYTVTMQWVNMTYGSPYFGMHNCTATPNTFSSSNANFTQNFAC